MPIIEGEWDCSHCGQKGIRGRETECPNCHDTRDYLDPTEQVRFPEVEREVTDVEGLDIAHSGASWTCGNCGVINRGDHDSCKQCHEARNYDDFVHPTITYVDDARDAEGVISTPEDIEADRTKQILDSSMDPNLVLEDRPAERPARTMLSKDLPSGGNRHTQDSPHNSSSTWSFIGNHGRKLLFGLISLVAIIALVVGGTWVYRTFIATHTVDVTVTGVDWQRSSEVEQYRTLTRDDWKENLPYDARVIASIQKVKSQIRVFDHYNEWDEATTKKVKTGTETVKVNCRDIKVDLGNGFFDKKEKCDTKQRDVYKDVPGDPIHHKDAVYRYDPVYATWYTYQVDRWVFGYWVTASGTENPYWPIVTPRNSYERAGNGRTESYRAIVVDSEGRSFTKDAPDQSTWERVHTGMALKGEQTNAGMLVSVNWP